MTGDPGSVDRVVLHVARLALEVRRGLRPPPHLHRLLGDGPAWVQWQRARPGGGTPSGPVTPADLGVPVVSLVASRVHASVPINLGGDLGWAALTIRLQRVKARWTVTDLTMLRRGRGYQHSTRRELPVTDPQAPLHRRLRTAEGDRRLVAAAAVVNRTTPTPWQPLLDDLDREIGHLRHRIDVLDGTDRATRSRR